jgi:hypothetical protein
MGGPQMKFTSYMWTIFGIRVEHKKMFLLPPSSPDLGIIICERHVYKSLQIMWCRNLNLGLMTNARACKGAGQDGSPGVTSHALGSVGKCEEMNFHTPK